jgi:hypothetical protein
LRNETSTAVAAAGRIAQQLQVTTVSVAVPDAEGAGNLEVGALRGQHSEADGAESAPHEGPQLGQEVGEVVVKDARPQHLR